MGYLEQATVSYVYPPEMRLVSRITLVLLVATIYSKPFGSEKSYGKFYGFPSYFKRNEHNTPVFMKKSEHDTPIFMKKSEHNTPVFFKKRSDEAHLNDELSNVLEEWQAFMKNMGEGSHIPHA